MCCYNICYCNSKWRNFAKNKYHNKFKKHEMKRIFKAVLWIFPANSNFSNTFFSITNTEALSYWNPTAVAAPGLPVLTLFSCFPGAALTGPTCSSCCWNEKRCSSETLPRHRWHRCLRTCWKCCLSLAERPALTGTARGKGQRCCQWHFHRSAMAMLPDGI